MGDRVARDPLSGAAPPAGARDAHVHGHRGIHGVRRGGRGSGGGPAAPPARPCRAACHPGARWTDRQAARGRPHGGVRLARRRRRRRARDATGGGPGSSPPDRDPRREGAHARRRSDRARRQRGVAHRGPGAGRRDPGERGRPRRAWRRGGLPGMSSARDRGSEAGPPLPRRRGRSVTRISYRRPFDWPGMLAYLGPRAIPGVEVVAGGVYRRTVELADGVGWIDVRPAGDGRSLALRVEGACVTADAVARVRRLFDLDADPRRILRGCRDVPHGARGIRVPGAWDALELAVRAVLGQQVTVRGATTLAGRLVAAFGRRVATGVPGLTRLFRAPATLARGDV